MLITDTYRDLNSRLHAENAGYGIGGWQWIGPILHFMRKVDAVSLLDYGAGKGSLARWMPEEHPVVNYDPVTFPDLPPPQDFVACLDVMEHIEPECVRDVIKHVQSLSRKGALFVISGRLANKTLEDGRNAHLIVEGPDWWRGKLRSFFDAVEHIPVGRADEIVFFCRP